MFVGKVDGGVSKGICKPKPRCPVGKYNDTSSSGARVDEVHPELHLEFVA